MEKEELKLFIDSIEIEFNKTWISLLKIKKRDFDMDEIVNFQIHLASTLIKIENVYQSIAKAHNYVLRHKSEYSNSE
jgi:hypothetical protein